MSGATGWRDEREQAMEQRRKPRIAVVLGDPAGIGPEVIARLLAAPGTMEAADILLVADRDEVEEGMRIAGCRTRYALASDPQRADFAAGVPLLFDYRGDATGPFERGVATAKGGRYSLDTLASA
jgi:4-hydroxy-L-threonine phosphate dehydrogenase PdxA